MSTIVEIKSEAKEIDSVEIQERGYFMLTLSLTNAEVVAELQNMGAHRSDAAGDRDVMFIDHEDGAITVLVEDEDAAADVNDRLANPWFTA
ncbi:hypothetical protein ACWG8W_06050 [Citricoccus zhacaiensis]